MKKFIVPALALTCLFPFVSNLQAVELRSKSYLQLRQGPGMHYTKTDQIQHTQNVKIGVCNPSWCHVSLGKKEGWVPTAQVNPDLARMSRNGRSLQTSSAAAAGGGGSGAQSSSDMRVRTSTAMVISMRIIAKDEARQGKAAILPFPVPAHRQISTR